MALFSFWTTFRQPCWIVPICRPLWPLAFPIPLEAILRFVKSMITVNVSSSRTPTDPVEAIKLSIQEFRHTHPHAHIL